jgi:hypothetical protein
VLPWIARLLLCHLAHWCVKVLIQGLVSKVDTSWWQLYRGIMVWIDGVYQGEGGCLGYVGGGNWKGGRRGAYGYSTSDRLVEPTSAWPSAVGRMSLYVLCASCLEACALLLRQIAAQAFGALAFGESMHRVDSLM